MSRVTLRHPALLGAALWLWSCHAAPPLPHPPEAANLYEADRCRQRLEQIVDVVVLAPRPPEGDPRGDAPFLRRFRRRVYEALVAKGYSPLRLAYVDEQLATDPPEKRYDPDSNRTRFGEDALLALSVSEWNRDYYYSDRAYMVSAALALIDSKTNEKIWSYEIRHRLYPVPREIEEPGLTRDDVIVDRLVADLLAKLPSRV